MNILRFRTILRYILQDIYRYENFGDSNLDPHENYVFSDVYRPFIESRVRVYSEDIWAEPVPDASGRFTEFSSTFFRNNRRLTLGLYIFVLRDLIALREVAMRNGSGSTILLASNTNLRYLIMEVITIYEIRGVEMFDLLCPILNDYTIHFCHELYNFANSLYDIDEYNRRVQHSVRPLAVAADDHLRSSRSILSTFSPGPIFNETTDSANEEDQISNRNEIIVYSSDVETSPSIETPTSSSMAQPSTSTGIQDSLDRQNNRYNIRSRRLVSPTVNESSSIPIDVSQIAPGVESRRPNLDSSSDDQESTTDSETQARMKS